MGRTSLAFNASLNSVYGTISEEFVFVENDSIDGLMGGTADFWGGNLNKSQEVTLIGESSINTPLWALNIEGRGINTDGVSFIGLLNFTSKDNELTGYGVGLYLEDETSGYLSFSELSGTVYPGISMWEADGDITAEEQSTTVSPEALTWDSDSISRDPFFGSITDDGFLYGDIVGESYGISDQEWGIFRAVAGGNTDTEGDSYWIASGIGRYTENSFTGNTYGYYLTEIDLRSFSGEISSSNPDGDWTITSDTSESLAFSGEWWSDEDSLYYLYYDGDSSGYIEEAGYESGLIGGLTAPWDEPADFLAMGEYYDDVETGGPYLWASDIEADGDGGYFDGITGGIWKDGAMKGAALAIYVNTDNNTAGILTDYDVSGNYYEDLEMWMAEGTFIPVEIPDLDLTTTVAIDDDSELDFKMRYGSFDDGGTITLVDSEGTAMNIEDQRWGIWGTMLGGTYTEPSSDIWTLDLTGHDLLDELNIWAGVDGSQWSAGEIAGKVAGAWIDLDEAITGVMGGELIGCNPTEETWQAVAAGSWMETSKFLGMASTSYNEEDDTFTFNTTTDTLTGTQALLNNDLNIPCIEVGRDTLASNGMQPVGDGSMSVTMRDVTFFSYSTGNAPRIWATHDVSGNYIGVPTPNSATILLTGTNLSAEFGLTKFDTSATNNWAADVNNGGGQIGNYDVTFNGGAAGSIDTINQKFSGTGAGVVPTATPPPQESAID